MGDESAQPGELPEKVEIWSFSQKISAYSQWLTQQVFVGFSINPVERVEPVIHLEPTKFLGKIIIQKQIMAIKKAKKDISDLILWSNEYKLESGGAGAIVVWKSFPSHRWTNCKISLGKYKKILDIEL